MNGQARRYVGEKVAGGLIAVHDRAWKDLADNLKAAKHLPKAALAAATRRAIEQREADLRRRYGR